MKMDTRHSALYY
ncbi:fimbrial chaperone protein StbB, partial [Salmonella enterica subsp. enterica serovar Infantis]